MSRGRDGVGLPTAPSASRWERLWQPFWMVPLTVCVIAFGLGLALPELDRVLAPDLPYVFAGGPDGARSLLGTIASAMISVTGLVFSITMVVLQLASSQFTPRVLSGFLSSRVTQVTLGVFTASFVFSLTVLRSVRGASEGREQFVPQLSVSVAFLLVLASVALFLAFIHHITTTIQVNEVISRIGDRACEFVTRTVPEDGHQPPLDAHWMPPPDLVATAVSDGSRDGKIAWIDQRRLRREAESRGGVMVLDTKVGAFVPEGQQLARFYAAEPLDEEGQESLVAAFGIGPRRDLRYDLEFGFRQLVDIADRALSSGINDPLTAVEVIDELHRILRLTGRRGLPPAHLYDDDGNLRVVLRPVTYAGLLDLAVDEIAHYGADSLQVPRRLRAMLDDLAAVVRPEFRRDVDRKRRELDDRGEQPGKG